MYILACCASLFRAQHGVLNTVFDLFDFFHFCYPFLDMIGKDYSFICKVKNSVLNQLFIPK
jgi:hypothetical protein